MMLMHNLRNAFTTKIPKLNYQLTFALQVIDLLLQEDLQKAYTLLCDRCHFLIHSSTHTLQEAVHFYEQLRGDQRPQKYKNAEISTQLQKAKGKGGYSTSEQRWAHSGGNQARDQGATSSAASTNPFDESNTTGQSQGGGGARRGRPWRRRGRGSR